MPALVITDSVNIASLDSVITADLCEGIFSVDVSDSVWISSGASNVLGANVQITNPYGVVIKQYTTSGYDIYPPMTGTVEVNVPTQASNYIYGNYSVAVQLTDADGSIYTLTKTVSICAPDSKNKNRNYGTLSATLDGNCVTGRVTIIADTPPNYKGYTSDSQVNDFLLKYPTVSEVAPEEITQNNFSAQLYEGEYQFSGTICAHYSLGDNVYANVNYRVKRFKTIRCLLDKSCVAARLAELQFQISQDCTDKEKIATQNTIINALLLLTVIDGLTNDGQDASDYIAELETVLGCICTCNCADGTPIIPQNPTGDFVVEGCNVSSDVAGLTTTYTINNYAYVVNVAPNGNAITINAPILADCTQTQTITFNVSVVYTQIKGIADTGTEYQFWASLTNKAWDTLDLSCVGTPSQWSTWTYTQRSQWLFNRMCLGGICDAQITADDVVNTGSDVTVSWNNVADVYEVAAYLDGELKGTVLDPLESFTFVGAADGNEHSWTLVAKCSNGSIGNSLNDEFTYFGCPTIALPTVTDSNVADAECPYDLSALVNTLPLGVTAEWHNLNNTNNSSLVANPTAVTGGVYYVFAKNSDGCYSQGVQVILTCDEDTTCSAPQNLLVQDISGGFRVRFQGASFPPPSNSYTVKRRLKASADIDASYTTIGTPTWNAGVSRWEILDETAINNTLYTYRAISNCTSSAPYVDYDFANLTCAFVTLTPADTSMGYSFTGVGGSVDKYQVSIYEEDEVTLIHTDTIVPAFSSPITGTFIYLTAGVVYVVKLRVFIGTYYEDCAFTTEETTGGSTYTIAYTNNNSAVNCQLLLGNNNSAPSYELHDGLYTSDPLTGTDGNLPAVNANVVLDISGAAVTITSAVCNGVSGTIAGDGSSVSWSGVNGAINITFVTDDII